MRQQEVIVYKVVQSKDAREEDEDFPNESDTMQKLIQVGTHESIFLWMENWHPLGILRLPSGEILILLPCLGAYS
jgi:hypothetical protein